MLGLFRFPFFVSTDASIGTTQLGQASLSKTEAHTETPMTQLGRAAASGSIIDRVWFVYKLSEPKRNEQIQTEHRPSFLIFVSANIFVAKDISDNRYNRLNH